MAVTWIGLLASVAAFLNAWPRLSFFLCFVCFLSFVSTAGDFSGYQSDGMLLGAGFLALFFAPRGLWPGLGLHSPPPRAALFLLQWEWFRIYFESGIVKLLSGDPEWRHLTAMDEYYQNGPLPTWIGYYVQHLPHWFHVATAAATLVMEIGIVWMLFLPRRLRLICLFSSSRPGKSASSSRPITLSSITWSWYSAFSCWTTAASAGSFRSASAPSSTRRLRPNRASEPEAVLSVVRSDDEPPRIVRPVRGPRAHVDALRLAITAVLLTWIAYVTTAETDPHALARRAPSHHARRRAGTLSHRQPVRPLRRHDSRPLRNRVPGLQ